MVEYKATRMNCRTMPSSRSTRMDTNPTRMAIMKNENRFTQLKYLREDDRRLESLGKAELLKGLQLLEKIVHLGQFQRD